jgi:hypothetical protein
MKVKICSQCDWDVTGHLAVCLATRGISTTVFHIKHVALTVRNRLQHKPTRPFRYRDNGTMATIGEFCQVN